ncbi:DsbA family protein [Actinomyces wuliandei]|uniref:DsbA family protein n=1 Tax=Actinomyces wuliandei TaxID=2057743 RepID=UPI000FD9883A|nr:thioredoxin domain-containing protein [Actinomyces wuliandei]
MASNQPRPTKAQRREEARARAKALREQEARRQRRATIARRSLLGAAVVGVAGVSSYVIYNHLQDSGGTGSAQFPTAGAIATTRADRSGVPEPVLSNGSWTYGPSSELDTISSQAPVLDVYFDYSCHFCASFETTHAAEISTLLSQGRITLVLHPSTILGKEWTDQAMNAMGVVLDEAPNQSMAFHTAVMELFGRIYEAQDTSMMTTENLVAAATSAQVPTEVSARFEEAVNDNTYEEWTTLAQEAASAVGVTATPTVYLDGEQLDLSQISGETAITELVEAAEASAAPAASEEATQEASASPTAEG